jgi:hypothetical protein
MQHARENPEQYEAPRTLTEEQIEFTKKLTDACIEAQCDDYVHHCE